MINAKKERKTIQWERLELSSKKIRGNKGIFHAKTGTKTEMYGPNRSRRY